MSDQNTLKRRLIEKLIHHGFIVPGPQETVADKLIDEYTAGIENIHEGHKVELRTKVADLESHVFALNQQLTRTPSAAIAPVDPDGHEPATPAPSSGVEVRQDGGNDGA
jgi:hypothetical protein